MRRILTTLVLTGIMASPGAAAFAATPTASLSNGSCNNMKGGNGATFNQRGNNGFDDKLCNAGGTVDGGQAAAVTGPATEAVVPLTGSSVTTSTDATSDATTVSSVTSPAGATDGVTASTAGSTPGTKTGGTKPAPLSSLSATSNA